MPPTARISHAPAAAPATTLAMTAKEAAIIDTALHLRGTPYRNGGSTPNGFDCSGFTQWVFAQHGLALPREVKDQFRAGTSINVRSLAPGDLVFFKTTASTASHVGIVLGPDTFVHAPSSRGVVRIEHLTSAYWTERLVGVRRVLQTN
jgi:cell wall-associated NlpC family hydrolase